MAVELFPKHSNKYIKTGNNEGKHLRLSPVVVSIFIGLNKAPSPKEPPPALGLAAEERALHGCSRRQVCTAQPEETQCTSRHAAAWSHGEESHLKLKGILLGFTPWLGVSTLCQASRGEGGTALSDHLPEGQWSVSSLKATGFIMERKKPRVRRMS